MAVAAVERLLDELSELRDKDAAAVRDALPLLLGRVAAVPMDGALPEAELHARQVFRLRQLAEQEATANSEDLFCLLISTEGLQDLRALNPYVDRNEARELLDVAVSIIVHANRVGQINRCLSEARGLLGLLRRATAPVGVANTDAALDEAASALALKQQTLAEQLLARRQYVSERPGGTAGTAGTEGEGGDEGGGEDEGEGGLRLYYDPRFLLFEFVHNIVLREAQVSLIREFVLAVRGKQPLVKQMLMGGGKTTVVGPMLALMLADGKTLVVQTMPQALLEQSKATLRATFSAIMRKRVFTLVFERSSELRWDTVEKLHSARHNRGVVLCTGSTIKSLQLKLLEKMDVLRDTRRKQHPSMEVDLRGLVEVMHVYRSSCLIMDEVDLLLHPLKSELNFPIGKKHALDLSPQRWQCAIHCCDAVFYAERRTMAVNFQQSARAKQVLAELCDVIEAGYEQHTLQRSPHLTLLNEEWYVSAMKPVMAKWMLLWLEANHVSGLPERFMESYITRDYAPLVHEEWGEAVEAAAAAREAEQVAEGGASYRAAAPGSPAHAQQRLHAMLLLKLAAGELTGKAMQLVNLAEEWLSTFLPHCLQKIDRVSFGLLSATEVVKLQQADPHTPRSRLKLAIPFLGKDVPSTASEFAHPDIIIGLTVLAYRHYR